MRIGVWRAVAGLACALACAAASGPAAAQPTEPQGAGAPLRISGPFDVVADELEFQGERDVYLARGNVKLTEDGRTLTADRVLFSNTTRLGVATGDVVVTEGNDVLRSDFLQFQVDTLLGVVFQGELVSGDSQYVMRGAEVRKTGEETYEFKDAEFTTCRCPNPADQEPWTLTAQDADLEIEGWATARNATFQVLGVPVFYTPYVRYPVLTERQTGFLFPQFSQSSRHGYRFGVPFFWAVRDDVNLTLTPEYLTKRGFKPSALLEYVIGERGEGELYATYINDQDVDDDDPDENFPNDRWGGSWRHLQDLPGGVALHADAVALSDNNVPFDFDDFRALRSERWAQSAGFLARQFGPSGRFALSGGVRLADDLQNPDDQDRDRFLLQRLPELTLHALPGPIPFVSGLVGSAELQYVRYEPYEEAEDSFPTLTAVNGLFYDTGIDAIPNAEERNRFGVANANDNNRDGPIFPDGTEGDGEFQEGEPLADRGHRVLANPRLAYPFQLFDWLEVYPEIGTHATWYDSEEKGSTLRTLLTGQLELRSRLRGSLDLPFGWGEAVHLIEPFVGTVVTSETGQDDNPLFVPETAVPQDRLRHQVAENRLLDPADRLRRVGAVRWGVHNRFLAGPLASLVAEVSLSAEYDYGNGGIGPLVLAGLLQPPGGPRVRFHSSYDLEHGAFEDALLQVGWAHDAGHAASLRYRYLREIPRVFEAFRFDNERFDEFEDGFESINELGGTLRAQLTRGFALTLMAGYSFEKSFTTTTGAALEYVSACRCWAVLFEVERDRSHDIDFGIRYRLLGLGDDGERPFGGPKGRGRVVDSPETL